MVRVFLFAVLCSCSKPLEEGSYEVSFTDMPVNECGVDEASLGAGSSLPVEVRWSGQSLVLSGFGPDVEWPWDGEDGFSASWEQSSTSGGCELISSYDAAGTIVSSASFTIQADIVMTPEGDCAGASSCAVAVEYAGVKTK